MKQINAFKMSGKKFKHQHIAIDACKKKKIAPLRGGKSTGKYNNCLALHKKGNNSFFKINLTSIDES